MLNRGIVTLFSLAALWPFSANAATNVEVRSSCPGSSSTCFTSINAAVRHAGPGSSVVRIYGGTHDESVDLSFMGADIGGSPADISLVGYSGAKIVSSSGRAIRNSVAPYPGSISVSSLRLSSATHDAFNVHQATGDVTVSDVVAENAAYDGIDIEADGNVTIFNVTTVNNGEDGTQIVSGGDVDISYSSSSNNGPGNSSADGYDIKMRGQADFNMFAVTSSDNGDDGIALNPIDNGVIELARVHYCTVTGNEGDGINLGRGTNDIAYIDDIDLYATVANNNGTPDDKGDGFQIENLGDIEIHYCEAHGNQADGMELGYNDEDYPQIATGTITASHLIATHNAAEGVQVESRTHIDIRDSTATDNGKDGFQLESYYDYGDSPTIISDVVGTRLYAYRNAYNQINMRSTGDCTLTNGYAYDGTGENSHDGIRAQSEEGGVVRIVDSVAQSNPDDGIQASSANRVEIIRSRATHNGQNTDDGGNGIRIGGSEEERWPASVLIVDSTAGQNRDDGIHIDSTGDVEIYGTCSSYNGSDGLLNVGAVASDYQELDSNQNNGIGINYWDLSGGPYEVASSNIGWNGEAGLAVANSLSNTQVDARANYWGAFNGPNHPSNPAGYGNQVVDGDNGGAGDVSFSPYSWWPLWTGNLCI